MSDSGQRPPGTTDGLAWRGGSDLGLRSAAIANRALDELALNEGGTAIYTDACPTAELLAPHVPRPIFRVRDEAEVLDLLRTRDLDLVLIGSDRGERQPALQEELNGYVPCLNLVPREAAERPVFHHNGSGTFHVFWYDQYRFPMRAGVVRAVMERFSNLKALFRHDAIHPPGTPQTRPGKTLVVYFEDHWAEVLDGFSVVDYVSTDDPALPRHLDHYPDLDLVLIGGCFCGHRQVVREGLQVASSMGVPCVVPADCGTGFLGLTVPTLYSDWTATIDGYDPHLLWRSVPAALQERRAWLLASGRPFDHLPRMPQ